jgi:hypothetical protein
MFGLKKENNEEKKDSNKKFIIDKCKILKEEEHKEIFKIIKKNNIKFTQNSNGIFINLNKLPNQVIEEIFVFVNYCIENKNQLKIDNNKRESIKKIIKDTFIQENFVCNNNTNTNEPLINVGKGIKYDRKNEIDQNELYYAENIIEIP